MLSEKNKLKEIKVLVIFLLAISFILFLSGCVSKSQDKDITNSISKLKTIILDRMGDFYENACN